MIPRDDPLFAEYRRRCWALVPIPPRLKGPVLVGWQTREFTVADFPTGSNLGLVLGSRSGELVDGDLDASEALVLADIYLPSTGAVFGRASKPRSHRLFVAPGAVYEAFTDPLDGTTLLELRAEGHEGPDGRRGCHQTVLPPSVHPSGERIEWCGDTIAPAVYDATKLRNRCAWLAIGCLVMRHVSEHAARHPSPYMRRLLWEADPALGRAAYRWLGQPDPDAPRRYPKPRRELSRAEIDLAELVAAIPNNCDWREWNRIGLAIYAASGGSGHGGVIFDDWSAKSQKYNPYETSARWAHFRHSPPDRIGLGTLVHLAREAGWRPSGERAAS